MFLVVVVVSALTIGGIAISLTSQAGHINMVARNAAKTAKQSNELATELQAQTKIRRALRTQQIAELHAQAVASCESVHKLVKALTGVVAGSPKVPGLTAAQKEFVAAQTSRTLAALASADCAGVKPLPKT